MPTAGGDPLGTEHHALNRLLDIASNPDEYKRRIKELTDLLADVKTRQDEARATNIKNQEQAAELTKRENAVTGREALATQREAVLGEVAALIPQVVQMVSGLLPKINAFNAVGQSGQWRNVSGPSGSTTTGQV